VSREAQIVHRRNFLALALWLIAGAAAAGEIPLKQKIVADLQQAIRANDKNWLADHMRYPVRYFGRHETLIRNKAAFVKNYDNVIGAKLRGAILAQDLNNVFENWQGMMVGEGSHNIWVRNSGDGSNERYQIVTINDSE
jgi:hypothetical protein